MAARKTQKTRRMLIDASHPEETRVVVIDENGRIEEFDYESTQRKQLKGNIYLARVTRVEPSLQAAFVDYGGNRHGFLAFSEIHPDYYQIPVADREALLKDEAEEAEKAEAGEMASDAEAGAESGAKAGEEEAGSVAGEDALDELPLRSKAALRRRYKIQEVIRRGQVMLVQVVKEERGNKGAALTTYLSLAGRYCVLMPNTARGGGISRKITDARDRQRLKAIAAELNVPPGMGLIIRTAGAQRTRAEIRRDFNYLLRLWESIRELTLKSTAPKLVYEEGNLVKRAIRDLYTKDIAEILVEGEAAWKEARAFMKMLMPSHVRNVKLYRDDIPLFARYNVDAQLDSLFSPVVPLPSGGYLVINQTEALVAIDINSGKATREHSIEDTALKTNLEAAEEIARQLRLRDLAGLIVIDFIDMEDKRNIRQVERKLKEALKSDRARIQLGRISQFGLLEMSRQRLRQGMLENATRPCPHCFGTGVIRSVSSAALSVLRGIEEHMAQQKEGEESAFTLRCHPDSAFYILNEKRDHLTGLEHHYGVSIYVEPDRDIAPAAFEISSAQRDWAAPAARQSSVVRLETALQEGEPKTAGAEEKEAATAGAGEEQQPARRKRRRRRGKRGGRKARRRAQARLEALQGQTAAGDGDAPAAPFRVVDLGEMVIIVRNRNFTPALDRRREAAAEETVVAAEEAGGGSDTDAGAAVEAGVSEVVEGESGSGAEEPREAASETVSGEEQAPAAEAEVAANAADGGDGHNGKRRRHGGKRGGGRRGTSRSGNGRRRRQTRQKTDESAGTSADAAFGEASESGADADAGGIPEGDAEVPVSGTVDATEVVATTAEHPDAHMAEAKGAPLPATSVDTQALPAGDVTAAATAAGGDEDDDGGAPLMEVRPAEDEAS